MNFCQRHWDQLKSDIDKFGLSEFVSENSHQVVEHIRRDIEGESTVIDFEPLIGAATTASTMAMRFLGLEVLTPEPGNDLPTCPACLLSRYNWTEGAAWQMVLAGYKRGLISDEAFEKAKGDGSTILYPSDSSPFMKSSRFGFVLLFLGFLNSQDHDRGYT